jgi:3-phenylpropionate/cinnamic acid dioxygenase small subunit
MRDPREIADLLEIQHVLYRYARAIDERDFDLLRQVFTPDATIHYDVPGGVRLGFREAVEWLRGALQIFAVTQHVMSNPLIELDGDRARSTTYLTASHVQVKLDGAEACVVQGGIYHDQHLRTGLGWRIAARRLQAIYTVGTFLGPDAVRLFPKPR